MMYLGDFPTGGKVAFLWNTHAIAGESITRATDGTLKIFKAHATAATWATERSSLAGVTQLEDFDATGIHSVYIDLSDNTDAGFYAAGNEYQVAIVGAVVDGKTVNVPLAAFSIERASGLAAILARLPASLVSGRIDASVGAMAANVITSTAINDGALTTAKLGSGFFDAVWSVATRLLTAGTNIVLAKGTGVTGFNDLSAAQVNAEADTALADYDGPTHAELTSGLAAADDAILARLPASLIGGRMDATVGAMQAAVITAASINADALWAPGEIADEVWDEPIASHLTAGSTGDALSDVKAKTDSLGFSVAGVLDANITHVNDIEVDGAGTTLNPWGPA